MSRAREGNRVLARRTELKMHILTLASLSQKSSGLISMIEGGYVPKLPTMQAVAAALETTPAKLWPGEFDPPFCGCAVWCGDPCGFQKPDNVDE